MSGVGKSLITAGLCRIFKQDGYSPAPFKSQNMALNSYVTRAGLEMGRAQVMQAYAAGAEPEVSMNPVLLKPTDDTGSQVIVNGRPVGNMPAREYFEYKKSLIPVIKKAYDSLSSVYSPVVIEGAGSPAEINLKENDIVNMGLARLIDSPVILVADIDRGGVFAQLYGTVMLLDPDERSRIKGFVINKFRGDPSLLDTGITEITARTGIPVLGVVPFIPDLKLEDEDSLTGRFERTRDESALITIAVIRLPRISNFSDMDPFEQNKDVCVLYTTDPEELRRADLIIIPGTKNTIGDMRFLKESGLADELCKLAGKVPIFGICGGMQILGRRISDPDGVETEGSPEERDIQGLGLLPVETVLKKEKHRAQTEGSLDNDIEGIFSVLSGMEYEGYEIHAGRTQWTEDECGLHNQDGVHSTNSLHNADSLHDTFGLLDIFGLHNTNEPAPVLLSTGQDVYGTYVHGFFDRAGIAAAVLKALAVRRGVELDLSRQTDQRAFREACYDVLADTLREHINMKKVYELLG